MSLIKGPEDVGLGHQADLVQVLERLWLDRRVVTDGNHTLGISLAQGPGTVNDREQATGRMVGDATIGALELMTDADVTKDVVW